MERDRPAAGRGGRGGAGAAQAPLPGETPGQRLFHGRNESLPWSTSRGRSTDVRGSAVHSLPDPPTTRMNALLLLLGVLLTAAGAYVIQRPRVDRSFAWSILIVGALLLIGSLVRFGLDAVA